MNINSQQKNNYSTNKVQQNKYQINSRMSFKSSDLRLTSSLKSSFSLELSKEKS